ncbi:MAG: tetratricopeptide repeat protein [Rhodospirillaceae bacterium]
MSADQDLARALRLHEAGDLLGAGTLYREILAVEPDHVDALNLLGVVMHAAGEVDLAIELTGRAAALAPDYAAPCVNLGNALQAAGRADEAVAQFQRGLELEPDNAIAASNLASALTDLGRYDEAAAAAEQAVALAPELPDAYVNLGNAQLALGQADDAVAAQTAALERDPHHAGAWFNLGNAHMDAGDPAAAVAPFRKAAELDPRRAAGHYNLGNALQRFDRYADAAEAFGRALALEPGHVDALCNAAGAWQSLGRTDTAVAMLKDAIGRDILAGGEGAVDLHWNLALALLQNGDMAEGWREYEWRWQTPTFADFRRDFTEPEWNGGDLDGRTLFVHAEQGFGDALQFVRYVPLAAARGGRVVLECRPELRSLFAAVEGVAACVPLGTPPGVFDVHVPLMSLPRVFGTSVETVPDAVPYINVPGGAERDARLAADGFKVGLVWSGSPTRPDNAKRSCPLADWAPILAVPGVRFFGLQVGPDRAQLHDLGAGPEIVDLGAGFADFADTAAAVAALDLVISVDTSVLHLAGALGRPAFALLSQPTGFLWMNDRADSPWYPTLRLFRQPTPGDWGAPVAAVAGALAEIAGDGA